MVAVEPIRLFVGRIKNVVMILLWQSQNPVQIKETKSVDEVKVGVQVFVSRLTEKNF